MVYILHYSEIALKGGNRGFVERVLLNNCRRVLGIGFNVFKDESRIIVEPPAGVDEGAVAERLRKIIGVAAVGVGARCEPTAEAIVEKAVEEARKLNTKQVRFAVEATRSYKKHPYTSLDLRRKVADAVLNELGWVVDLKNPDVEIYVEAGMRNAYVYLRRFKGFGGLPVGSSGRVLSLLSGGVDSAVASWMMMQRGCRIDYLHLHAYRDSNEVMGSKIPKLINKLTEYGIKSRIFLASFTPFYQRVLNAPPRLELILFRHYLLRVAEKITDKKRLQAIVTGDSLGQVASQTLQNLETAQTGIGKLILRPLIGMPKEAIIQKAREIEVLDIALQEYKDCCSIVSRHPATSVKPETLLSLWDELGLDEAVEETVDAVTVFTAEMDKGLMKLSHLAEQLSPKDD